MEQDRLGRRRKPEQGRGLRPLHPVLPVQWNSKALRLAMSEADWARFDALVRDAKLIAPTHARACGLVLSKLLQQAPNPSTGPANWMDWERQKTLRLLRSAL
ncbi:hypothetical protein EP7_000580 [Isosphaeraceae bacterium EP7]